MHRHTVIITMISCTSRTFIAMVLKARLLLCVLLSACIALCKAADDTLTPGASGSDVVHAVVGKIQDSNIFPADNQLLRRIAFVESKDGTDSRTYRSGYHGGIWQVDKAGFADTQATSSHRGLDAKFDKIQEFFGIDWRQVQWEDLRRPLYSGLAARLLLSNVDDPIPMASDIEAQGQYWKTHYNSDDGDGTVDKFVSDVEALLRKETCNVNSDNFFVLDASGSIRSYNFGQVRSFVYDFVNDNLKIGPNDNQVGVITFSRTGRVVFYLNSYSTKAGLLTAIQNIPYDGHSTNTADGLCKLIHEDYTTQNGARLSSAGVHEVTIPLRSQVCRVNSDIFFVLDTSTSIGEYNFREVRSFVYNFVNNLKIGPNDIQVGVISFSTSSHVNFYLNSYSTKAGLLREIQYIPYSGGSTNIADGLYTLIRQGYTSSSGARLSSASVSRLAVVMTDGMSDSYPDTVKAAEAVHSFEPSILVYAIGVTNNFNVQELNAIASKPEYVSNTSSFDSSLLQNIQEQQTYELCNRASVAAKIGNGLEGNLDMGENIRYQYLLPEDGMTIVICVQVGNIVLFASTRITTPNSALYEYKLDVSGRSSRSEVCNDVYVKSSEGKIASSSNTTLYMTLSGMDVSNTFALNSTIGDTTSGTSSMNRAPWNSVVIAVAAALVLKAFA